MATEAIVYPQIPELSVKEAWKQPKLKSDDERLHDIYLILHRGFESRCRDFMIEKPHDT